MALGPTRLADHTPGPTASRFASLVGSSVRGAIASAPPWAKSRRAVVAAAALALVALGTVVIARGHGGPAPAGAVADGGAAEVPASASDARTNAVVAAAQSTIDRGDFATAIDELTRSEEHT